ncbi:hypothetical protein LTR53_014360, partial [Teratosphaeriaceae sp. CCFEE 6253]
AQGAVDTLGAVDFVISEEGHACARGNEVAKLGAQQSFSIWILLSTGPPNMRDYHLAHLTITNGNAAIERLLSLKSYHGACGPQKPRLLLPKPGHTAHVVFGDAVVLVSTTTPDLPADDPNAQLHEASYLQREPFEDAVYLHPERDLSVLSAAAEDPRSGHQSSAVAFVKGAGLVRVSVTDPSGDVERTRMPAKSKLEQAVFYGAMQDNILDFGRRGTASPYSMREVEDAALAISDELLRSSTPFLSASPGSVGGDLEYRAKALRALVEHVRGSYGSLGREVTWRLLWDAERVAAAREMWRVFEQHIVSAQAANGGKRTATVMDELVDLKDLYKGVAGEEGVLSDDDPARRFFARGLVRLDHVLSRVPAILEQVRVAGHAPESVVRHVIEADELLATALETAFAFRGENARRYGLDPEDVEDGVLSDLTQFAELPEFWTSTKGMLKASSDVPKLSREIAKDYYEAAKAPPDLVKQVTDLNPRLIELCCLVYHERIHFEASRPSTQGPDFARRLQETFDQDRHDQFRDLASVGSAEQGMLLAERHRDMQTLTELVVGETQYYADALRTDPAMSAEERKTATLVLDQLSERVGRYFDRFGDAWADAYFDEGFSWSQAGEMLERAQEKWRGPLTRYLRADPARGKICWINDVLGVEDYMQAGVGLYEVAVGAETRCWAKGVEVGMSKLALLAAREDVGAGRKVPGLEEALEKPGREMRVLGVQEKVYEHVRVEVRAALDQDAEVQLAMEVLGKKVEEGGYDSLRQLLAINLEQLLGHSALKVEELIDVLTLMDCHTYESAVEAPDANLKGTEFSLALQALDAVAPGMPQEPLETLLQLIWKRCYTYDNWSDLTTKKTRKGGSTDSEMQERLQSTAPWRTFFDLHDLAFFARPGCSVRVLAPSECLGAACQPEDLAHRFASRDLLDPILQDNRVQDEVLQGYVADRGLDTRVRDCERAAKEAVQAKADGIAGVREKEREVQEQERAAKRELRSTSGKANGHINGFANGLHGADEDGDIEMA